MPVPIPQNKPAQLPASQGSFNIDFLLDLGKNALSRVAEIKLEEYELDRLAKARVIEAQADFMRDTRLATGDGILPQNPLGMSQKNFVMVTALGSILLLGMAAFSISRR